MKRFHLLMVISLCCKLLIAQELKIEVIWDKVDFFVHDAVQQDSIIYICGETRTIDYQGIVRHITGNIVSYNLHTKTSTFLTNINEYYNRNRYFLNIYKLGSDSVLCVGQIDGEYGGIRGSYDRQVGITRFKAGTSINRTRTITSFGNKALIEWPIGSALIGEDTLVVVGQWEDMISGYGGTFLFKIALKDNYVDSVYLSVPFNTTYDRYYTTVCSNSMGNMVLGADQTPPNGNAAVIKIDINDTLFYQRMDTSYGGTVFLYALGTNSFLSGSYVYGKSESGQYFRGARLIKYDWQGNRQKDTYLWGSNYPSELSVSPAPNSIDILKPYKDKLYFGSYSNTRVVYLTGSIFDFGYIYKNNISLYQLDTNLNVKWKRTAGGDAQYILRKVLALDDGGVLGIGMHYDPDTATQYKGNIFLLRLDSSGIGEIITEREREIENELLVSVYPNPATHMMEITAETVGVFELTDLAGRSVLRSNEKRISVGHLPRGMYYYNWIGSGGKRKSGKLVLE